jgi:hypothetical protein
MTAIPLIVRTYRVHASMPWGANKEYTRYETATIDASTPEAACCIMCGRYAVFARVHNTEVSCRADEVVKAAW